MSEAEIRWVGGPVLYARIKGEFRVGEAIEVGRDRRPGEVIRLKGDELVGQVYEDITGARPGDPVYGTGGALSIRLGPGLLGGIFDGLLRPLDIELASETSAPNGDVALAFRPSVATGDVLPPGTAFGMLPDSAIRQLCLLPPDIGGTVESIVAEGAYGTAATLCTRPEQCAP
jgi:V/A-type H+/Na+-transporting ATPase subunit A